MSVFVSLFLVTTMGIISGPPIEKGQDCAEVGKMLMETDYITQNYGCHRATFTHPMSMPERNPKR